MAPTPNAIDLTTYQKVEAWGLNITPGAVATTDQQIQDIVTAFSNYTLQLTGRGNADGSVPTASPFNTQVSYDEWYDGNGNDMLPLNNWPIGVPTLVNANGVTIPQSTSANTPGWVVDQSNKFLAIRGGRFFYPQRYRGPLWAKGWPIGVQNINVQYPAGFSATPFDLEMVARKVCALNYIRQTRLGQKSQAMAAGAGTVSYGDWEMDEQDVRVVEYYCARA